MPSRSISNHAAANHFTQADLSLRSVAPSRLLKAIPALVSILTDLVIEENKSDTYRLHEANRRLVIITSFQALLEGKHTKADAARILGVSGSTVWRWTRAFARHGLTGLLPETDKCGRKPARRSGKAAK